MTKRINLGKLLHNFLRTCLYSVQDKKRICNILTYETQSWFLLFPYSILERNETFQSEQEYFRVVQLHSHAHKNLMTYAAL